FGQLKMTHNKNFNNNLRLISRSRFQDNTSVLILRVSVETDRSPCSPIIHPGSSKP
ncbi:Uncharacterized protein APZ42_005270, partial [Daphnia magna]